MGPNAATISQTIQLSLTPVFLLVALGNLLGVFTGRLARVVDRSRALIDRHGDTSGAMHQRLVAELRALDRRMGIINLSILLVVASGVVVCLLVALLFAQHTGRFDLGGETAIAFAVAMLLLLGSLVCFLVEVRLAIRDIHVPMELLERE